MYENVKMKEVFILVLSFPLMKSLFNNTTDSINTSSCQCTCHIPYLGVPGDNLSAKGFKIGQNVYHS